MLSLEDVLTPRLGRHSLQFTSTVYRLLVCCSHENMTTSTISGHPPRLGCNNTVSNCNCNCNVYYWKCSVLPIKFHTGLELFVSSKNCSA